MEKFSFSKIDVFSQCGYKYKLIYVDKHFIKQDTIATDFGSLIHFVEETMLNILKEGKQIDYRKMIDLFYNGSEEDNVKGVNKIKELYPVEFVTPDKNERTYEEKVETYIDSGITRLEDYLTLNPNLEIIGAEIPFLLNYKGYTFQGSIDRVFQDKLTKEYYIEDIKTYSAPLDNDHLVTPLQFVVYANALKSMYGEDIQLNCKYELPLCNMKQNAGTKGFIKRGLGKIDKLLTGIEKQDFKPNPTPLCHWCVFSKTYPNQPEEAKHLCPYFSHWTKENKVFEVENEWMGNENHDAILQAFIDSETNDCIKLQPKIKIKGGIPKNIRWFSIKP